MKTISEQLGVKEFPFEIFDKNGNVIYYEKSNGYWSKREYDSNGNEVYYENSEGFWRIRWYDSQGNKIYSEKSNGLWQKTEYDSQGNIVYFEKSNGYKVDCRKIPEYTMEELVEKLGNFKLKK